MQVQHDGDLEIVTGELVTVTVTAIKTHYLAIFGDLLHAEWMIVSPVQPVGPEMVREVRIAFPDVPLGIQGRRRSRSRATSCATRRTSRTPVPSTRSC